jgi:hypothetical protein
MNSMYAQRGVLSYLFWLDLVIYEYRAVEHQRTGALAVWRRSQNLLGWLELLHTNAPSFSAEGRYMQHSNTVAM